MAPRRLEFRSAAGRFDRHWYLDQYADLEGDAADPLFALSHYATIGHAEGRRPNPDFDEDWYRRQYPSVARKIEAGELCNGFHDYLQRATQNQHRLPGPTNAVIGIDVARARPSQIELSMRMASFALAWEFCVVAPFGSFPSIQTGPNVTIVDSCEHAPRVDLWLTLAEDFAPSSNDRVVHLPSLIEASGHDASRVPAGILYEILERLRLIIFDKCPIAPRARRSSGPLHLDLNRVQGLRITMTSLTAGRLGGGVVIRNAREDLAEFAPPAENQSEAVIDTTGFEQIEISMSDDLLVEFAPAPAPSGPMDVILVGRGSASAASWRHSLASALKAGPKGNIILSPPPATLKLDDTVLVADSLQAALALNNRPAIVVPVGVRLFPQAISQALSTLKTEGQTRSLAVPLAIRHPSGHLTSWRQPKPASQPINADPWRDEHIIVQGTAARRRAARHAGSEDWPRASITTAASLGAIGLTEWTSALTRQADRAPAWLQLDSKSDGAVIGKLRLHANRLADGGHLVLTGDTTGLLAGPCPVLARALSSRRGAARTEIAGFTLPESGTFTWKIDLLDGQQASKGVEIVTAGPWITNQRSPDPRPVLFYLEAIRYRPVVSPIMSKADNRA